MAVTSVEMKHDGWKGTKKIKGEHTFEVNYIVYVDNDNDGAQVVLEADGLPTLGDGYKAGNDEVGFITLQSLSAQPLDRRAWVVSAKYGKTKQEQEDKDSDNDDDDKDPDPVYWQPTLQISLSKQKRVAQCGAYVGKTEGLKDGTSSFNAVNVGHGFVEYLAPQTHAKPSNNKQMLGIANAVALTNSAGTAFDPPPQVDYSRLVFRYTRNVATFPTGDMTKYLDTVNVDAFTISNIEAFDLTINPFEAKMANVTGTYQIVDNDHGHFEFWAVTYEFHVDKIFGWRLDILDRGYSRTNRVDKDGAPRSMATGKNRPFTSALTDADTGHTLQEPVRLDGNAEMLQLDDEDRAAVFMRYAVYPEIKWAGLNF